MKSIVQNHPQVADFFIALSFIGVVTLLVMAYRINNKIDKLKELNNLKG